MTRNFMREWADAISALIFSSIAGGIAYVFHANPFAALVLLLFFAAALVVGG